MSHLADAIGEQHGEQDQHQDAADVDEQLRDAEEVGAEEEVQAGHAARACRAARTPSRGCCAPAPRPPPTPRDGGEEIEEERARVHGAHPCAAPQRGAQAAGAGVGGLDRRGAAAELHDQVGVAGGARAAGLALVERAIRARRRWRRRRRGRSASRTSRSRCAPAPRPPAAARWPPAHRPTRAAATFGAPRQHPLATLVPLLVREASTERLNVRALNASATEELVRRATTWRKSGRPSDSVPDGSSEGNALYLTELLRSLEEEGLLDRLAEPSYAEVLAQTPVPALLQLIVDDRLARLGDETAALLAVAAVVGQEVSLAVWMAVAQVDEETVHAVAERAETAHLVAVWPNGQGIRFTHALIPTCSSSTYRQFDGERCTGRWGSRSPDSRCRTRMPWRTTSSRPGTSEPQSGWCARGSGPRMPTRL